MDAFWTRYFPAMYKLRELVAEKVIGDVMLVTADFGGRGPVVPEKRHFNPDLAGGAMLDVGSYCIQFASMIYGKPPTDIVSQVAIGETGVDELSVLVFKYSDYEMATLTSAIRLTTPHEARVMGTEGYIAIPNFWHPSELTVVPLRAGARALALPLRGRGLPIRGDRSGAVPPCWLDRKPRLPAGRNAHHHGNDGPHTRRLGIALPLRRIVAANH